MPHHDEQNGTKQYYDSPEIHSFGTYGMQVIFEFFDFFDFDEIFSLEDVLQIAFRFELKYISPSAKLFQQAGDIQRMLSRKKIDF